MTGRRNAFFPLSVSVSHRNNVHVHIVFTVDSQLNWVWINWKHKHSYCFILWINAIVSAKISHTRTYSNECEKFAMAKTANTFEEADEKYMADRIKLISVIFYQLKIERKCFFSSKMQPTLVSNGECFIKWLMFTI